MVARLIEGWESSTTIADYAGKWSSLGGGLSIDPSFGRYGNGIRRATGSTNGTMQLTRDPLATWIVGFAFRISALPNAPLMLLSFHDGGTQHCGISLTTDTGVLFAWRGTPSTGLSSTPWSPMPNTWAYIEVKCTIDDTAGVVVVRVNGTTILNLTGVDTRNGAGAYAGVVRLGHFGVAVTGANDDYDDIYIFDATGSVNNDFAGDCRVEQIVPNGAGASTAWTPSAGSNYQCVDDAPPNGDTDYVSSAAAGNTDTYTFADLLTLSGTIQAVQATALARDDAAGSGSIALVARPGSTNHVGATQGLGVAYGMASERWDTNPDTAAAWTIADLNASQFGVRQIA
jgi:hypothetical protein